MRFLKVFVIISAIMLSHSAIASFTSTGSDDSRNKYSLKHLNKLTRTYTSFQLKYRSNQVTGSYFFTREANGLSMSSPVNTYLLTQKATTTYVYPYKYTVKVPRFKTPSRPQ